MPFNVTWHTLLEEAEDLPPGATLLTPLSHKRFRITDTQEHRIVIEMEDADTSRPLQRDQFETLYERIQDAYDAFEIDRIPPEAEPYAAVLTLHPRFEIDENTGTITETESPTTTQVVSQGEPEEPEERTEPDISVYSDALLLIDALERQDLDPLEDVETNALVNLYTLLSDVQRGANDLRQDEIEESEYVRKAEVDEDVKETRLQGLKDRLAAAEDEEAEELREEIEELEGRIEELTEFRSGQSYHTRSTNG